MTYLIGLNDEDEPLIINDIRVDFNPINKERSGSIEEWLERNYDYDKYNNYKENDSFKVSAIVHDVEKLSPEKQELFKNLVHQMSDKADKVKGITSKDKELMNDFLFRAIERDSKLEFKRKQEDNYIGNVDDEEKDKEEDLEL